MPPRRAPRSCICMRAIPKDGRPSPDPAVFMQFLPRIKQATDAVINITTGGAVTMTVEERLAAPQHAVAGNVLAQHGLDEFRALSDGATATRTGSTIGRRAYLRNSDAYIFRNTFRDIEKICQDARRGARRQIRARVLRRRPSLQSRPLHRSRHVQAAGLRAADLRHSRRHRRRPRQSAVHEAHGRPAVRRPISTGRCWPAAGTR